MNSSAFRDWAAACRMSPLAIWLAVLASLASVAALQASLFPRWPRANPLPEAQIRDSLRNGGLSPTPATLPKQAGQATRNHDRAFSAVLAYHFPDGEQLQLVRVVSRERKQFTPSAFASKRAELDLNNRRLAGPPPWEQGQIQGRPALQTCLVALSPEAKGYGVTWEELSRLVDRAALGTDAEIRRFLGLQANRDYTCVLITLRSADQAPVSLQRWNRLLQILPAALGPRRASGQAAQTTGGAS